MGLYQSIWGPNAWVLLHSITLTYPLKPCGKDRETYQRFLKSFGQVLMCDVCKVHYNRNLEEYPPKLDSRKDFFEWMVDLHNEVNGRTGKRAWTYQEALEHYQNLYQTKFTLELPDNLTTSSYQTVRQIYCFWLTYHKHIIILILIIWIAYLERRKLSSIINNIF
jgi:hypothetical protein